MGVGRRPRPRQPRAHPREFARHPLQQTHPPPPQDREGHGLRARDGAAFCVGYSLCGERNLALAECSVSPTCESRQKTHMLVGSSSEETPPSTWLDRSRSRAWRASRKTRGKSRTRPESATHLERKAMHLRRKRAHRRVRLPRTRCTAWPSSTWPPANSSRVRRRRRARRETRRLELLCGLLKACVYGTKGGVRTRAHERASLDASSPSSASLLLSLKKNS